MPRPVCLQQRSGHVRGARQRTHLAVQAARIRAARFPAGGGRASGAGDGIELLADADLFAGKDQMDAVKIDKDLILDLAGHTLKARLQVTNGTTTLVGDGTLESIDARLTATFVATALTVDAGAAAVVDGLTVKSKAAGLYAYGTLDVKRAVVQTTEWAICANDSCNVTLGEPGAPDDDVVVTSERGNCLSTAAATGNAAAKVTINSGTYETGAAAVEWNAGPVYWASHGTLAVSAVSSPAADPRRPSCRRTARSTFLAARSRQRTGSKWWRSRTAPRS